MFDLMEVSALFLGFGVTVATPFFAARWLCSLFEAVLDPGKLDE